MPASTSGLYVCPSPWYMGVCTQRIQVHSRIHNLTKLRAVEWACNLSAGDVEIGKSWALWQASPGYLVRSRPIRKPVSIKDGQH